MAARFSRYFSPLHFNRPTTYQAVVANKDLEVFDLQEDPEETRNLAQDGTAKGELMMALNDKLNARIDEEVGEDNSRRDNEAEAMQTKVLTRTERGGYVGEASPCGHDMGHKCQQRAASHCLHCIVTSKLHLGNPIDTACSRPPRPFRSPRRPGPSCCWPLPGLPARRWCGRPIRCCRRSQATSASPSERLRSSFRPIRSCTARCSSSAGRSATASENTA